MDCFPAFHARSATQQEGWGGGRGMLRAGKVQGRQLSVYRAAMCSAPPSLLLGGERETAVAMHSQLVGPVAQSTAYMYVACLGHGFHVPGHGFQSLDYGFQSLDHGFQSPGHGFQSLGHAECLSHKFQPPGRIRSPDFVCNANNMEVWLPVHHSNNGWIVLSAHFTSLKTHWQSRVRVGGVK